MERSYLLTDLGIIVIERWGSVVLFERSIVDQMCTVRDSDTNLRCQHLDNSLMEVSVLLRDDVFESRNTISRANGRSFSRAKPALFFA